MKKHGPDDFPVGASVKVRDSVWKGRTGLVVALPGFPWRDCRLVKLDPRPPPETPLLVKPQIIYMSDLKLIPASDRPQPPTQLTLI